MMERRIKERLVGATLLVVLIVLVVPEMLSGPRKPLAPPLTSEMPALTRHVTVDLTTSKATAEPASEDASPPSSESPDAAEASEPPPSVATLHAQQSSTATLETPAAPLTSGIGGGIPHRALVPPPAVATQAPHRGWSVQLGSFANRANAERLAHQLEGHGASPVYVSASGNGSGLRYRVRMGPLADRGSAEHAAGKLRAAGHPGTLVAPGF